MGVTIKDLRKPVQPIAAELHRKGFSMIDLTSIGFLFLNGMDANQICLFREEINRTDAVDPKQILKKVRAALAVDKLVSDAEGDAKVQRQRKNRVASRGG